MNKSALIIPMPKLNDEAAAGLRNFLQELLYAVEEHYYQQFVRHYNQNYCGVPDFDEIDDDKEPF